MSNPDREHPLEQPVEPQDRARPADAEKKLGMSMLMKVALGALIVSSLIISISCLMKANQAAREAEEVRAECEDMKDRIERMNYYINEEVDDAYIAEFAREMYDMFFPDEEVNYNDVNE